MPEAPVVNKPETNRKTLSYLIVTADLIKYVQYLSRVSETGLQFACRYRRLLNSVRCKLLISAFFFFFFVISEDCFYAPLKEFALLFVFCA